MMQQQQQHPLTRLACQQRCQAPACPGEETTECYSSKGIPPEAGLPTDMLGEPGLPAPLLAAGDLAADAADLAAAAAEACMAIWIWLSNSTSPFLAFAEASAGMADD